MNLVLNHNTKTIPKPRYGESRTRSAFHAAGIAATIYLGNKQKGLPPVYFEISINTLTRKVYHQKVINRNEYYDTWIAEVEGGLLITHLPESTAEATKHLNETEKFAYERVFDADIINLFAGPIAEAQYVAARDGEVISPRLVNLQALSNYCAKPELDFLHRRLDCLHSTNKDKKIFALYLQAFKFVNERANWQAIEALSNFLLAANNTVITYHDIVSILESTGLNNQQLEHVKFYRTKSRLTGL